MITKTSIKNKAIYIWTFIIIYMTDSLLFATNADKFFINLNRFGVVFIAMFVFFKKAIVRRRKIPIYMILLSVSVMVSAIQADRLTNGYSYYTMIACLWFSYMLSDDISLDKFAQCYCDIMRVIAIVSLVAWIFAQQIISMDFLPTITNSVGARYKFLFLTATIMRGDIAKRNMGPFWEPGAYQVYLTVALFFTLFIDKRKHRTSNIVIFILASLSTLSGAALIPILVLVIAYALDKKRIKSAVLSIVILCSISVLFSTGTFDDITAKLRGESENNSITYRLIGMEGAFKGFLENPVFGSTPERNEEIKSELAVKRLSQEYASNTNTYINFLAYYGIFVGGFMLIKTFNMFRKNVSSPVAAFLCFLAYFLSTSNENMMGSLLIVFLAFVKNDAANTNGKELIKYESG